MLLCVCVFQSALAGQRNKILWAPPGDGQTGQSRNVEDVSLQDLQHHSRYTKGNKVPLHSLAKLTDHMTPSKRLWCTLVARTAT